MAAAARADEAGYVEEGDTTPGSTDPEVSLRIRNWSGADSLHFGTDSLRSRDREDNGAESRFNAVEDAVRGINSRFDRLLNILPTDSFTPAPRGRHEGDAWRSAPAPPTPQVRRTGRHEDGYNTASAGYQAPRTRDFPPELPRRDTLRGPAYNDYVEEQLRREEYHATRVEDGKGIASDILTKHLDPKPYMYIKKAGVNTLKKKLEERESMTFNEYILAYIRMVRDPRADQMGNIYHHLEHLQHLAEDALARDWGCARAWSQDTLDDIEKGAYTWQDQHLIQLDRIKHALGAKSQHDAQTQQSREERVTPCREFNGERGCINPTHHGPAHNRFMHICAYCYMQTGRHIYTHGKTACIRKDVDGGVRQKGFSKNGQ